MTPSPPEKKLHSKSQIVGTFYEKELQKANQKIIRNEKLLRENAINGKNYPFNSLIDKKDIMYE